MKVNVPYQLIYDSEVRHHVKKIERHYHPLIRRTIAESLSFQPGVETRNRKPLLSPSFLETEWEIRFGPDNRFRVFYRIDEESHKVYIVAVGIKIREKLFIGGEEIVL